MGKYHFDNLRKKINKMPGRLQRQNTHSKKSGFREKAVKFTVDISQAIEDDVIDQTHYVDFLKNNLKVDGKKGNLEYFTKKYLKQQDINNYLRVIASDKLGYKVKFI